MIIDARWSWGRTDCAVVGGGGGGWGFGGFGGAGGPVGVAATPTMATATKVRR